jgi:hypothetical protein
MSPVEWEVHRRNALLRAHRAVGVPIEGRRSNATPQQSFARILGINAPCGGKKKNGKPCGGIYWALVLETRGGWSMQREEATCRHLKPLVAKRLPPEVEAIAELELLAGGA